MSPVNTDAAADPETRPGFARRAETMHLGGDTSGALHLLTAGVRLHPGDVIARLVMARVCRESGRDGEARDWLESALRADPECPAALFQLGDVPGDMTSVRYREKLAAQEPWDEWFGGGDPRENTPQGPQEIDSAAGGPLREEGSRFGSPSSFPSPYPLAGGFPELRPEPRAGRREHPSVPVFNFPVREEAEELEIEENSAPHVATVTLAEIYLQQGLKEQAVQIYRQLLERQPGDDSVRRRLHEIEGL